MDQYGFFQSLNSKKTCSISDFDDSKREVKIVLNELYKILLYLKNIIIRSKTILKITIKQENS